MYSVYTCLSAVYITIKILSCYRRLIEFRLCFIKQFGHSRCLFLGNFYVLSPIKIVPELFKMVSTCTKVRPMFAVQVLSSLVFSTTPFNGSHCITCVCTCVCASRDNYSEILRRFPKTSFRIPSRLLRFTSLSRGEQYQDFTLVFKNQV